MDGEDARPAQSPGGLFTDDDARLVLALNVAVADVLARARYIERAEGLRETSPRVMTWTVDLGARGRRRVQLLVMREDG